MAIRTAQFQFTLYDIAQRLAAKALSGTRVEMLIHEGFDSKKLYFRQNHTESLRLLATMGGLVRGINKQRFTEHRQEQMHHKFWLFGTSILVTGSWNASGQAEKNWENAVVITNKAVIAKFVQEYIEMRKYSRALDHGAFEGTHGGQSQLVQAMNQLPPYHNTAAEEDIRDELDVLEEVINEDSSENIAEVATRMERCIISPRHFVRGADGSFRVYYLQGIPADPSSSEENRPSVFVSKRWLA